MPGGLLWIKAQLNVLHGVLTGNTDMTDHFLLVTMLYHCLQGGCPLGAPHLIRFGNRINIDGCGGTWKKHASSNRRWRNGDMPA